VVLSFPIRAWLRVLAGWIISAGRVGTPRCATPGPNLGWLLRTVGVKDCSNDLRNVRRHQRACFRISTTWLRSFWVGIILLFGAFLFFPAAGFLCLTGGFFCGAFPFFDVVAREGWSSLADFPGGDVFFEHGGLMFAVTYFLHCHFLVTCYIKRMRSYSY